MFFIAKLLTLNNLSLLSIQKSKEYNEMRDNLFNTRTKLKNVKYILFKVHENVNVNLNFLFNQEESTMFYKT